MTRNACAVPLLLLAACAAAAPLRPVPAREWARGAEAYVAPSSTPGQESVQVIIKADLEQDLQAAGLSILQQERAKGELDIFLGDFTTTFTGATLNVRLQRDGRELDRFTVNFGDLDCVPATTLDDGVNRKWRCLARDILLRTLESKPVAAAMGHKPAPAQPVSGALAGKLAVLELRNFAKDLTRENAQYFTDLVRGAALRTQPQLQVMTRENLLVLLRASGKAIEDCEGECEVDTGRRIGADAIVSGELQKLGSLYKLSLRLHDTHEGRLLASTQASGKTVEELDESAQRAAEALLGGK